MYLIIIVILLLIMIIVVSFVYLIISPRRLQLDVEAAKSHVKFTRIAIIAK